MPKRKVVSNDLREATDASHQSKGYKAIIKQIRVHSAMRKKKIFISGKDLRQWLNFPGVDVPANSPEGQTIQS